MKNILTVTDVSKSFKSYSSEFLRMFSWFGFQFSSVQDHNVLKKMGFSISPGEAVGIVGRNGAGKSTLLKIITGTLKPSTGGVEINGTVAAILELGMGFNPDLTGRQNVFHSAGLMGHLFQNIESVINKIEEFAEIGEYFDQPVRVYSSGMQARLAFSVATAFRPDLLIVDEALSVGDASFQAKCFQHMLEMKKAGTSVLLVSHDAQAIKNFCDRAILLHEGAIAKDGETKSVLQLYEKLMDNYETADFLNNKDKKEHKVKLLSCHLENEDGNKVNSVTSGETIKLVFQYKSFERFDDPHYGIRIADRFGLSVFETNTYCMKLSTEPLSKNSLVKIEFKFNVNLVAGNYLIDIAMVNNGYDKRYFKESLSMTHDVLTLTVYENPLGIIFGGVTNLMPEVSTFIKDTQC